MFELINQVFIVSLKFSGYLATKCMSINKEPCMTRPFLIDLNPVELIYYPLMINLDKCTGCCSSLDDLSTNYVFRVKQKI